ncbi:MAG TPA: DHHA1 domain-containing protein [Candidatus Goldiibacteriota bacterium]|nr:DHHA1 domain-containing protein [Candidatus Goldiibacteriota bacterium]
MALFEEKYGDKVRTISIADISMELCGGTHLRNTGEIGLFKIVSASSTAAGVRRIEAVTGKAALALLQEYEDFGEEIRQRLKAPGSGEAIKKLDKLIFENRELEKQVQEQKKAGVLKDVDGYIGSAKDIGGVKALTLKFSEADKEAIRNLGDILKAKMKKAVIVIANTQADKAAFLALVTDDLTDRLDASKIVKAVAAVCKGGGGGRRDMAEAGGKDPSKVDEALALYAAITAPVLSVQASDDSLGRWWKERYTLQDYHQRLAHVANSHTAVVQDAGHMLHHDQPQAVAALIENFVTGQAPA